MEWESMKIAKEINEHQFDNYTLSAKISEVIKVSLSLREQYYKESNHKKEYSGRTVEEGYAHWLEEKVVSLTAEIAAPKSEYKQCEHDFKWSSISKYGTCKKCGERMHG